MGRGQAPGEDSLEVGANEATLDEKLGPNEAILVKINNDRGWHVSGGVTESDPIGFLLIDDTRSGQQIKLQFRPSWDVWLGRAITAVMILGLIFCRGPRLWMAGACADSRDRRRTRF